MTMTYTEALRKSRGLNKTAALPELAGWQRAGIGGLGGGLLTAGLTSLVAPRASTRSKLLAALIGAGGGAAAGYRYLPGYNTGKDVAEAPASAPAEEKPDAASATPVTSGGGETKGEDKDKREAPTGTPSPDAPSGGGRPDGGGDGGGGDGGGVGLRELLGGAVAVEGGRRLWKKYRAGRSGGGGSDPAGPGSSGGGGGPSGSGPSGTGSTPRPGGPSGAGSPSSSNSPGKGATGGGGKAPTMSVEDLRREQDMEYRRRMRLDPDVLPDIAHFDPAGYQLDKMGPRNAAKFLREVGLGFDPRIPREVQLKALQSAFTRNSDQVGAGRTTQYWPSIIARQLKEKAINDLKKDNPNFEADLEADAGERGSRLALYYADYIPIRLRNGKYSLRKVSPYERFDPLSARAYDEGDRLLARRGTDDVWDAKQFGARLVPDHRGKVYGWVPEMAPSAESKSVRASRLARAVNAGSRLLPILLRALDN